MISFSPTMRRPTEIVCAAWLAFALYWLWAARKRKKVQRREALLVRWSHMIFIALALVLLDAADTRLGALHRRFVPDLPWVGALGAALTVAGIAFAIWARRHLGRNWSGTVTIKEGHELIRSGPYQHIRHPIYTGILAALAGTAVLIGEVRALIAVALVVVGLTLKAAREESFLATEFGSSFEEYRRHSGFFLPR